MKPNYEQQSRELAERCATKIAGILKPDIFGWDEDYASIIHHELNLAKLLEDAAMLDWLQQGHCLYCWSQDSNIQPYCFEVDNDKERMKDDDVRTAIRNAMKEDK